MRTTVRAFAVIALLASACGGLEPPEQDAASDELRWRWCRSKSICRVPHTWWRYCTDTSADPRNCGGCGVRCGAGEACVSGACTPTCDGGLVGCAQGDASSCTDITCDPANCGGCGVACASGQECRSGTCADVCPGGLSNCGTAEAPACLDLKNDEANCGTCGTTCAQDQVCSNGACTAACSGETFCTGSDGASYCTNTATDSGNCGTCGTVCQGGTYCQEGVCACGPGQSDCGLGCQDTESDHANCGACGNACDTANNLFCQGGTCQQWCGGLTACGGGCVDTSTDAQNCGACGRDCGPNVACVSGACAPCARDLTQCGDACVNVSGDPSNCGTCGTTCPSGQCVGGACVEPPPGNTFEATVTFDELTSVPVTTMGFDGTNLWTGGQFLRNVTPVPQNWASYGRSGSPGAPCPSAITYDTRGVFSPGAGPLPRPVYMRMANSGYVYQMNGCSVAGAVANLGAGSGIAWAGAVNVVMSDARTEYLAMSSGVVHRWTACSTAPASPTPTCGYLGATPLQGWNQGEFTGEGGAPQNVRMAVAGDKFLTYWNGKLSVWDAGGNRVRSVDLVGAGTTADSHYSLSFADGLVWVIDAQGGTWRGYLVGL